MQRVLRKEGTVGFTCWTKPGWVPSFQDVVPDFALPSPLFSQWKDPDAIKANLSSIGFSNINIQTLAFKTHEQNLDAYLELMKLLLSKVLVGDTATKYDDHMRGKYERGDVEMTWQALVVTAIKA